MIAAAIADRGPTSSRPDAESFASYGDRSFSPMWRSPMLKEKDALPRSKLHFPIDNRYCLARARQRHPDMRWHIVAAFRTVREVIGIFGHQPVEELFQIAACGRIRIFHDEKAATGVLHKHSHCSVSHVAPIDRRLYIIRDFVQSFTFAAKIEVVVMDMH
jgi:hypothetical protein